MKIIPIKIIILIVIGLVSFRNIFSNYKKIFSWLVDGFKDESKPVFVINDLSDSQKQKLIQVGAWNKKCPVSLEDLKILTVSFKDFKFKDQVGQIIVHKKIAGNTINLFKDLFQSGFPLSSVRPIYDFSGSDDLSMQANNTNAFHCRFVTYSKTVLSKHSYGTAIDFNPVQNPYYRRGIVLPNIGQDYLDRSKIRIGMVESIVHLLKFHGFGIWAGSWSSPKDYMHFEFME